MPLTLERANILIVALIEIVCRYNAVVKCGNATDALPLALVSVHHRLQRLT